MAALCGLAGRRRLLLLLRASRREPHPLGHLYFGPLFFGLAAIAFTIAGHGYRFGLLLLIIIGAIDLGLYSLGNRARRECGIERRAIGSMWPTSRDHPTSTPGGVYDTSTVADVLWLHGYRLINGYMGGMAPQRQLDYRHVNTLRVAEVAWFSDYWTPAEVPGLAAGKRLLLVARSPSLAPARAPSRAVVSASPGEDSKKIDIDHVVLVTHPIALPNSPPGTAKLTGDKPGRIRLNVAAPERQVLVVSETYHSGWKGAR